jgi:Protein of unknown function (DUF5131)
LENLGKLDLTGIHWVIVGGKSEPKARPMQQEWVLNIKRQCNEQPFRLLLQAVGRLGSGRQEAGEEAKWAVVAREDVGCSVCTSDKYPNSKPDAVVFPKTKFSHVCLLFRQIARYDHKRR